MLSAANPGSTGLREEALAPLSRASSTTRFTTLPAEATGITVGNPYNDPRMWGSLHQEFKFGAIGTGVAIGDYDGDGRPDLFLVGKTGDSRLYRNLGAWRFEDVTLASGITKAPSRWEQGVAWARGLFGSDDEEAATRENPWSQGASFVDVDNDGHLDLYVCRFGAPNQLFINQGDGTFREEAAARGLAVTDASSMAAFADFDRDGWLDVFVQTNLLNVAASPSGQPDRLFRNNGDGTFTDVTPRAGIRGLTQGHSATWWDFDHDGWPDLYGAHDFAPPDTLYRNHGDGTFTNVIDRVVPHQPHSAMGADLGDINNDGLVDFLVADMAATSPIKDQRGMAKVRALLRDSAATDREASPQVMRNALYLATGRDRVLEAAQLAGLDATDWTWSVLLHDLDNDGRLDVHVTNGMVRELHNADLVQRQSAAEGPAEAARILKAAPPLSETNLAFRNLGGLRFESIGPDWGLDQRGVSFGTAAGDLDGDGDLDLVIANYDAPPTILRNDSTNGHRLIIALRGTRSNRFGIGASVEIESASGIQIRPLVLARGYLSSGEPVIHFGLGTDDRIHRLTVTWPSGHVQTFEDLPVDRRFTIDEPSDAPIAPPPSSKSEPSARNGDPLFVEASSDLGFALESRQPWFDETSREPLLPFRLNRRGPALAAADLSGDGRPELILGGTSETPLRILGNRAPTPQLPPSPLNDGPILAFDANGDGSTDLLLTRGGTRLSAGDAAYQPVLLLNTGNTLTQAPADALPALPISVGAAAAADFDRDGHIDVFIGGRSRPGEYPRHEPSALLHNRGGRFIDATQTLAPALRDAGIVTSALWFDVDDDGWLDLVVACEWGTIRCWLNRDGVSFEDASDRLGLTEAGTGWWRSLAAADLNGDGRPDIFAGNAGLNTTYRAAPNAPTLLFRGDFTGRGRPQLLEALTWEERLLPRRSRNELAAVIPAIGRRFPRQDLYARAAVEDLVGTAQLAAAERYAASELRSGVFLSRPEGGFHFQPLVHEAQIAPIDGVAVADLNADGHTDLVVAHNSHAPIASIGRFDGGLGQVLLGDGQGNLRPMAPQDSGVFIPGDGEALVLVDRDDDGWPELFVTRNDASTLAFRHQGIAGHRPLRIDLPFAPGARLTLTLRDGTRQTVVLTAGHGHLTQSASSLFFGYTENNPPTTLDVRWPDGRTTRHTPPLDTAIWRITPED